MQVAVAYSVHVGEKIAQCWWRTNGKKFFATARGMKAHTGRNAARKLGVKTRWLENERRNITREIICGFENFPLRKERFSR